ncbi:MAG: HlyD family secretion protein [Pirellula sp.]
MMWIFNIIFVSAIYLVYKVFKIKPRPWNIAIFVTVFCIAVLTLVTLWTQASPYSTRAVVGRYAVPIVPWVQGQVVSIVAKPNVPLKKGDVLFEIDPTSYQYAVNQAKAALQAARSDEGRFSAGVLVAEENIAKVEADLRVAKSDFDMAESLGPDKGAISKQEYVLTKEKYISVQAALKQAEANLAQAKAADVASKDAIVLAAEKLKTAEFSLTQCTVRAPNDGFVTNWVVREGSFVVPSPAAAVGTLIETTDLHVVAPFKEQMLANVKRGQEVELVFKSHPGRLFRGKVDAILEASGEGQGLASGTLPSATKIGSAGVLAVKVLLDDQEAAQELDMGTAGSLAIYTEALKPIHLMSRVTMRMNKWLYFFPFM